MKQIKEYRPINLTVNKDDSSGVEFLLAELSEVIRLDTQGLLPTMPYRFQPYDGDFFVYILHSPLAQNIISNPEEIVEIDFDDFEAQPTRLKNSSKTKAYFHQDYIAKRDSALGVTRKEFGINHNLQNAISECLLVHHTEMYFTYLFRYIIFIEYEQKGQVMTADLNQVFERYKKFCAFALKQISNVQIDDLLSISAHDQMTFITDYKDVFEYGGAYRQVISTYVIYRDNVKEIIRKELNDSEPIYPMFNSLCMVEGYKIALNRMQRNLSNKSFLDHELIKTDTQTVIKLFPTPYCFLLKEKVQEMMIANQFDQVIDDYFEKSNITRVVDEELKKKLGTRFIFRMSGQEGLFYFKKRKQDGEYAPFGEQDRTNPLRGLMMKGQLNFTLTKEF